MFETAKTLEVGDIFEFTSKMKRPENCEHASAKVTQIEVKENIVTLTYVPCDLPNSVQCGFGCHFIKPAFPEEWGWQTLKILRKKWTKNQKSPS